MTRPPRPAGARRGIGSVGTALRVLEALAAAGRAASLSEIARAAGISASQAHRYLASLIAAGMARRDAAGALYDLGPRVLRLGLSALARLDPLAEAERAAARLVAETGRTVLLAVWGDAGPTVVRWLPGRPALLTTLGLGSVLPVLGSATGRVFLAFGDAEEIRAAARREAAARGGDADQEAACVRAEGIARADSSLIPGLRAAAAPVFDAQGRLALVMTTIAAATSPPAEDPAVEAVLRQAARMAGAALGFGTLHEAKCI
ncbi:MAG: helix-turn-helix domain-containing protein [Acetobacteraceae bacterium]|nr:helix-turn-helix domain-containing protein [Acetobacteraceae bacterium]